MPQEACRSDDNGNVAAPLVAACRRSHPLAKAGMRQVKSKQEGRT
jgi:hypothetical protein